MVSCKQYSILQLFSKRYASIRIIMFVSSVCSVFSCCVSLTVVHLMYPSTSNRYNLSYIIWLELFCLLVRSVELLVVGKAKITICTMYSNGLMLADEPNVSPFHQWLECIVLTEQTMQYTKKYWIYWWDERKKSLHSCVMFCFIWPARLLWLIVIFFLLPARPQFY